LPYHGHLLMKNEDSPQQATGYQREDNPEPARSKLRGIAPKEIEQEVREGETKDSTMKSEKMAHKQIGISKGCNVVTR
jgi:hypothetical protein